MVQYWVIQSRRSYGDLSSQAEPARENRHFALVKNIITHILRILAMFDINFLEIASRLNAASLIDMN